MALLKSTGNKKVNLDFNKEFINTFSDKIENGNIEFINQILRMLDLQLIRKVFLKNCL